MDRVTYMELPVIDTEGKVSIRCRWMLHVDVKRVHEIEKLSYEQPWSEGSLREHLRTHEYCGRVAELPDHTIAGYMLYEYFKTRVHIANLAVHPALRRKDIGAQMARHLICRLDPAGKTMVTIDVHEVNLAAQLFLKSLGFRCESIRHKAARDKCDSYRFVYRLREAAKDGY